MRRLDLIGKKFHKLEAVEDVGTKNGSRLWKCVCECGNTAYITAKDLSFGIRKSCGCLHRCPIGKHGQARAGKETKTYMIWKSMVGRCTSDKSTAYKYYGAIGITVSEEWLTFENFFADMGECPKGLSLERVDNNAGYSKDNCIWASREVQANNKSNNRFIEVDGVKKSMSQWARHIGMSIQTLSWRINEGGMEPSLAVKHYMERI